MQHRSTFATINDVLHAVVISGALAVTALGLSEELFAVRVEDVLAVAAAAIAGASVAYAAMLAQTSRAAAKATLIRRRGNPATISP